jgi:hypothetical protein
MTVGELRSVLEGQPSDIAVDAILARLEIGRTHARAPRAPRASRAKLDVTTRDTSTMSDADVRAYYKSRALYDDARFHASQGSPVAREFASLAEAIRQLGPTVENRRAYLALLERWAASTRSWAMPDGKPFASPAV